MQFRLISENIPKGDQPEAIRQIVEGLNDGTKDQVLLGITGSGKTFTIRARDRADAASYPRTGA